MKKLIVVVIAFAVAAVVGLRAQAYWVYQIGVPSSTAVLNTTANQIHVTEFTVNESHPVLNMTLKTGGVADAANASDFGIYDYLGRLVAHIPAVAYSAASSTIDTPIVEGPFCPLTGGQVAAKYYFAYTSASTTATFTATGPWSTLMCNVISTSTATAGALPATIVIPAENPTVSCQSGAAAMLH